MCANGDFGDISPDWLLVVAGRNSTAYHCTVVIQRHSVCLNRYFLAGVWFLDRKNVGWWCDFVNFGYAGRIKTYKNTVLRSKKNCSQFFFDVSDMIQYGWAGWCIKIFLKNFSHGLAGNYVVLCHHCIVFCHCCVQ